MNIANKILMVFTGGTIASRLHKQALQLGAGPYAILDLVPEERPVFDIIEPLSVLSENMTPEMYRVLFSSVIDNFSPLKHRAVLIAHGTDTLAFSAQLGHIFLSHLTVPVIFFGSNKPIQDPKSDARGNFKSAIALAYQLKRGVYVVGRAQDRKTYVHHASLIQSAEADSDSFSSFNNKVAGRISKGTFHPSDDFSPVKPFKGGAALVGALKKLDKLPVSETVLCLPAVPSARFDHYPIGSPHFKYTLIRTHHSGTANALSEDNPYSVLYLKRLCDARGKRIFMAPMLSDKTLYSSNKALLDEGIIPVWNRPFEAAWAILMVCSWLEKDPDNYM
ncbi:MAG: hypothetical protein GXY06_01265 [Clostridiaceae bacterium]|mgnify:CR=1 FL=1|nr:hypothetical protein [Clostridiaceae bacterium]